MCALLFFSVLAKYLERHFKEVFFFFFFFSVCFFVFLTLAQGLRRDAVRPGSEGWHGRRGTREYNAKVNI